MIPVTLSRAPYVRKRVEVIPCIACASPITNMLKHAGGWKRAYCIDCQDLAMKRQGFLHRTIRVAIRDGKLKPAKQLECTDCGEPGFCYDHRDWQKPLEVVPVCKRCNIARGPATNLLVPQ